MRMLCSKFHDLLLVLCGTLLTLAPVGNLEAQQPAPAGSEFTLRSEVNLLSCRGSRNGSQRQ